MSTHKRRAKPGKEEKMKTIVTVLGIVVLSISAWAAGNTATARPRSVAMTPAAKGVVLSTDTIAVPQLMSYQGKLLNSAGDPVPDSIYSVAFGLFPDAVGGSAFWTEAQSVQTRGGLFNVLLGSFTPVSALPEDGRCYLQMQVQPDPPMTPRTKIVSSAYAFLAQKAESANYAASSPVTRPISPPVSGSEIAKPCTLLAAVPSELIRLKNTAVGGLGVLVDSANVGVWIERSSNALVIKHAAGSAILIDTTASVGLLVGDAQTGLGVSHASFYGIWAAGDSAGGNFGAGSASGVGINASAYNGISTDTAIRAWGKGIATGGWSTGFKDGSEGFGVVAADRMVIASGTARLVNGQVHVDYPELFRLHVRHDVPVRISATPMVEAPGLLVVSRGGANGFDARLQRIPQMIGSPDAEFDWIAVGVLEEPTTSNSESGR
jgi:hypothetical protein